MRMDEASNLSRLLGVPIAEVLEHAGMKVSEGNREAQVVGYVDSDGEVHIDLEIAETVPAPADLPATTVALVGRTAGGPLDYMDGWTVFFALPNDDTVPPDIIGRFAIVQLESGVKLMRQVRRGYKPGTYNLGALTAANLDSVRLVWASPVLYMRTNP